MNHNEFLKDEKLFKSTLTDSNHTQYRIIDNISLIDESIISIRNNNLYDVIKTEKNKILLTYTEIDLLSFVTKLSINNKYPHYIVCMDGTIFQLLNPVYKSNYLDNNVLNEYSIVIAKSSFGPLKLYDNKLETIYSRVEDVNKKKLKMLVDTYCSLKDINNYIFLDKPQGIYPNFVKPTDNQYNSLNELIDYICNEYKIPFTIYRNNHVSCNGISSYYNYTNKKYMINEFKWINIIMTDRNLIKRMDDYLYKEVNHDSNVNEICNDLLKNDVKYINDNQKAIDESNARYEIIIYNIWNIIKKILLYKVF